MDGPGIVYKNMDGIPGTIGAERQWRSGADGKAIRYAIRITFYPDQVTSGIAIYGEANGQGQLAGTYEIAVWSEHVQHGGSIGRFSPYLPGDVEAIPVCVK